VPDCEKPDLGGLEECFTIERLLGLLESAQPLILEL
jgi:hypothetical protein